MNLKTDVGHLETNGFHYWSRITTVIIILIFCQHICSLLCQLPKKHCAVLPLSTGHVVVSNWKFLLWVHTILGHFSTHRGNQLWGALCVTVGTATCGSEKEADITDDGKRCWGETRKAWAFIIPQSFLLKTSPGWLWELPWHLSGDCVCHPVPPGMVTVLLNHKAGVALCQACGREGTARAPALLLEPFLSKIKGTEWPPVRSSRGASRPPCSEKSRKPLAAGRRWTGWYWLKIREGLLPVSSRAAIRRAVCGEPASSTLCSHASCCSRGLATPGC